MTSASGDNFTVTSWGWNYDKKLDDDEQLVNFRLYRVRSKDGELRGYVALPHPEFGATDALIVASQGFGYVVPDEDST